MSRYGAEVDGGVVTNVLLLDDGPKGDEAIAALGLVEQRGVVPVIGWLWNGDEFSPPPPPPATWEIVRSRRGLLLGQSDWTQVADAPVDQQAWAVYRQELRDIPQDFATPDAVVWPEQP